MSKKNKGLFGSNEELDVMDVDATVQNEIAEPETVQNEIAEPATDVDIDATKAKKKASAEAWKAKKAAEKEEAKKLAQEALDLFKEKGVEPSEGVTKWLNGIINGRTQTSNGTGSNFEKAFGPNPKVGDTVTLLEVFQKTLKEKSSFDWYTRKWAEKGIIIEYKQNSEDVLKSTYTIIALPNA